MSLRNLTYNRVDAIIEASFLRSWWQIRAWRCDQCHTRNLAREGRACIASSGAQREDISRASVALDHLALRLATFTSLLQGRENQRVTCACRRFPDHVLSYSVQKRAASTLRPPGGGG